MFIIATTIYGIAGAVGGHGDVYSVNVDGLKFDCRRLFNVILNM